VLAEILSRMGDQDGAREALVRFLPATAGGRMAHVMNPNMVHFVTASTALSLVRLGLYDSALNELRRGLREDYSDDPRALKLRAQSYLRVAAAFAGAGRAEHREAAIRMSLEIFRTADALNAMAKIVARRGDLLDSRRFLEQSILVNARQAEVHLAIAELFLAVDPDVERALSHLDRAEQLHAAPESKVARLRQRLDRLMDPSRGAEP
jgi:tetratricopeptide (TPR) repeat protein